MGIARCECLGDDAGVVRREQEGVLLVQRTLGAPHRPRRQRAREPDIAELERGAAHRLQVLLLALDHLAPLLDDEVGEAALGEHPTLRGREVQEVMWRWRR